MTILDVYGIFSRGGAYAGLPADSLVWLRRAHIARAEDCDTAATIQQEIAA